MYILFTVPNHSQYTRFGNRETRPCLFSPISPSIIGCFRFLFHLLFAAIHPFLSFVRRVLLYSTCRSFVRQTCSFVRQMRSTVLHVSFFCLADAFFRSTDAFYSTARVVLSFGRCVLFCVYVNIFHGSINYLSFIIDNLSLTINNYLFHAVLSSERRFKYKSSF